MSSRFSLLNRTRHRNVKYDIFVLHLRLCNFFFLFFLFFCILHFYPFLSYTRFISFLWVRRWVSHVEQELPIPPRSSPPVINGVCLVYLLFSMFYHVYNCLSSSFFLKYLWQVIVFLDICLLTLLNQYSIYLIALSLFVFGVILNDGPFNFQGGGYGFFLKKIFWFPMLLKKYSDFGGGKKIIIWFRAFVI